MISETCPCGSGSSYDDCCGPLHAGGVAATPEALMRSRYSAFAVRDRDHLLRTWHPSTRPADVTVDPAVRWTRLRIVEASGDIVEFRAHYRVDGDPHVLHERSRFVPDHDAGWLYLKADGPAGS